MIKEFVDRWDKRKGEIEDKYKENHPEDYAEIVKNVVSILEVDDSYGEPSSKTIESIDHGNYQGTLLFIIGEGGYQPDNYWYVKVDYGSCSGCDTLEAITNYDSDKPTESQVKDYMSLSLHILQGIKSMQKETR